MYTHMPMETVFNHLQRTQYIAGFLTINTQQRTARTKKKNTKFHITENVNLMSTGQLL